MTDNQPKTGKNSVTVVIPRDLWISLKYEALRRQTKLKQVLAEAIEQALKLWKSEHERAS